jgi:thioredoxin-dependent peroxiredoxin
MATIRIGDKAPDFALASQAGKIVKLTDFRGKKLLIYFYPKADTPGCTAQACSVRDSMSELAGKGISVVGISPDPADKQKKFEQKYSLNFPLLSDEDHKIAIAYGAWGEKSLYGKAYMGILRSSFLIDEVGTIIEAWYNVKPEDTVPNARKLIKK